MRKAGSLQRAEAVIAALDVLLHAETPINFYILERTWLECFDNCREQGLVIVSVWGKIAVTSDRHSDALLVYHYVESQGVSNLPQWDKIIASMNFPEHNYGAAAEWIHGRLMELFTPALQQQVNDLRGHVVGRQPIADPV